MTASFGVIVCIRKILFCLSLVYLQNFQRSQICVITFVNIIYYFILLKLQPYKSPITNRMKKITELLFCISLMCLCMFPTYKDSLSYVQFNILGYTVFLSAFIGVIIEVISVLSKKVGL